MSDTKFTPWPWELRRGQWGYHGCDDLNEDEWNDEEPIEEEDREFAGADNGGGFHLILNPEANEREPGSVYTHALIDLYDGKFPGELGYQECKANARLISAGPDLYAYAEAEEKLRQLQEAGYAFVTCQAEKEDQVRAWWAAADRLFPEITARCPEPGLEVRLECFGNKGIGMSPVEARDRLYGSQRDGEGSDSLNDLLEEHLTNLRTAALAKARGEVVR